MKLLLLEIFCPDPGQALASNPLIMISGIGLVGALEKSFQNELKILRTTFFDPGNLHPFLEKLLFPVLPRLTTFSAGEFLLE